MSKTEGPLLSIEAHGTIGSILTYQRGHAGPQAHKRNIPKNTDSAGQQTARNNFALAVATWKELTPAEKAVYNTMKIPRVNLPGFNIFIKKNFGKVQYWHKFGAVLFGEKGFGGP